VSPLVFNVGNPMIDEIRKLESKDLAWALLTIVGAILPGFLTIAYFKPALLERLDFAKLLLFSASLALPIVFAQTTIHVAIAPQGKPPTKRRGLVAGALITIYTVYSSLLCAYIFHLSFRTFLVLIVIISVPFQMLRRKNHIAQLTREEINE
jgi:hypothetical protein